jgi:serine/threonine protein kinase
LAILAEGPVKNLHDAGFVHCDLRPENIMRCDDKGDSSDWVLICAWLPYPRVVCPADAVMRFRIGLC